MSNDHRPFPMLAPSVSFRVTQPKLGCPAGYRRRSACAQVCVVSCFWGRLPPVCLRPLMGYSCQGPDTGLARQQFHCNRPSVCLFPPFVRAVAYKSVVILPRVHGKQHFASVFLCVLSLCKLLSDTSPSVFLKTQLRLRTCELLNKPPLFWLSLGFLVIFLKHAAVALFIHALPRLSEVDASL